MSASIDTPDWLTADIQATMPGNPSAASGIALGVVLSAPFWIAIAWVWHALFG